MSCTGNPSDFLRGVLGIAGREAELRTDRPVSCVLINEISCPCPVPDLILACAVYVLVGVALLAVPNGGEGVPLPLACTTGFHRSSTEARLAPFSRASLPVRLGAGDVEGNICFGVVDGLPLSLAWTILWTNPRPCNLLILGVGSFMEELGGRRNAGDTPR